MIRNSHPEVRNELYITRARLIRVLETEEHVQQKLWKVTNCHLREFALFKANEDGKIVDYNPVHAIYESSHDEVMQEFCDFNSERLLRSL